MLAVDLAYDWFFAELEAFTRDDPALPDKVHRDRVVPELFNTLETDTSAAAFLNMVEARGAADAQLISGAGELREFFQPAEVDWIVYNHDAHARRLAFTEGTQALARFLSVVQAKVEAQDLPDNLRAVVGTVEINQMPVRGPITGLPQVSGLTVTFDLLLSAPTLLG